MLLVGVFMLVAAAILGLVAIGSQAPLPRSHLHQVEGFVYWTLTGLLGAATVLSLASIGIFLLPFAVLAVFITVRRFAISLDTIGLIAGFGLAALGIGLLNLGNHPCPSSPVVLAPGQLGGVECGGLNPVPWLLVGLTGIVFALGTVWLRGPTRGRSVGRQ